MRFFGRRQTEADDAHHGGNAAALAEQMKEVFAGEERLSEEELLFGQLWKEFCSSNAIAGRNNPALQNQLLPVRFRPFMTEFCEKY